MRSVKLPSGVTVEERSCTEARVCRECDAPILWTETTNGKRMPVDAPPVEDGKYVLRHRRSENKLFADRYLDPETHHGRLRYTCHFETCPVAQARKKR